MGGRLLWEETIDDAILGNQWLVLRKTEAVSAEVVTVILLKVLDTS